MKTLMTLLRNTGILVVFILPTLVFAQTKGSNPASLADSYNSGKTSYQSMNVYPNPTKDFIEFKFDAKYDDVAIITFYDSKGQMVYAVKEPVSQGTNYMKMDVMKFSSGTYFMTIDLSGYGYATKFMKY